MTAVDEGNAVSWDHVVREPGRISARVDRVELAIHEAAHAVLGYLAGCDVPDEEFVFIDETPTGSIGRAPLRPQAWRQGDDCFGRVVAQIAGDVAVECMMPGLIRVASDEALRALLEARKADVAPTPCEEVLAPDGSDEEQTLALIAHVHPDLDDAGVLAIYRHAEATARHLVAIPFVRCAIEGVMTGILEHGRISGRNIARIIELARLRLPPAPPANHAEAVDG